MVVRTRMTELSLPGVLLADAIFEFAAGAMLIALAPTMGGWLSIDAWVCVALGVAFLVAGAGILALRRRPVDAAAVRALALANLAGGALGWLALVVFWSTFEPGGRAALGVASDVFLALGALEVVALRGVAGETREAAGGQG
jgi:hypothetical protein